MYKSLLLLAFAALSTVSGEPNAVQLEERANCAVVTGALLILKPLGAPATSFCSSYLKIAATSTVVSTITPPPVTSYTSTATQVVTSAACPNARAKRAGNVVVARNAKNDRAIALEPEKRDVVLEKRINIPALSMFAASQLSSGCACLSIKPKTTTTSVSTAPAPVINTVTTTTSCTTPPPPVCTRTGDSCTFDRPDLCCSQACCAGGVLNCPSGPSPCCCDF